MRNHEPSIVFAGGGTGGHLFPALAVADELRGRYPGSTVSFVGARRGLERRLVPQAGYPLLLLQLSGIKGRGVGQRIAAALAAGWAVARCVAWMVRRRPAIVIGVGGYASGPAMLAAILLRIRTMVMEQNHYPGATNRWLARRVDAVCVPSDAAKLRLGGIGSVTGNPTRAAFHEIGPGEPGYRLSLLVFGGSRGAHSINEAMIRDLDRLDTIDPRPRIVHQTGADDLEAVRRAAERYGDDLYEVHEFLDDMPRRLAEADLVVCRAGASTLAELCAAGRPALLVPYPHAADDHQTHNAATLRDVGAAELIADEALDGGTIAARVRDLAARPERLVEMGRAARTLALPDAVSRVADIAGTLLRRGGNDVS